MTFKDFGIKKADEILGDPNKPFEMRKDFARYLILLGAIVHDKLVDAPVGSQIVLKLPDGTEKFIMGNEIVAIDDAKPPSLFN